MTGAAMDEARLRTLVERLDRLVPRAGGVAWEASGLYGSEHDEGMRGNRLGYLRLGIEMLRIAGAEPAPGRPDHVLADLSYLGYSGPEPEVFERREGIVLPALTRPSGPGDSVAIWVKLPLFALAVLVSLFVIARWLWRLM